MCVCVCRTQERIRMVGLAYSMTQWTARIQFCDFKTQHRQRSICMQLGYLVRPTPTTSGSTVGPLSCLFSSLVYRHPRFQVSRANIILRMRTTHMLPRQHYFAHAHCSGKRRQVQLELETGCWATSSYVRVNDGVFNSKRMVVWKVKHTRDR